ncbi:MAG: SAV_6107 family HEPN domain-containing protein [Propioniciclava sp.]
MSVDPARPAFSPGIPVAGEGAALDDIEAALALATAAGCPAERYIAAHRAALRVAAWVLASRRPRLRERCSVWIVVARVAPELAEWADYFAVHQTRRQVVEAGAVALISAREADDLLRDARAFQDAARLTRECGGWHG